jgi:hypothetical protein
LLKNTSLLLPTEKTIFRDKSILLISTEAWGEHMVSKHHYATQLAELGNQVYFLNPPNGADRITQIEGQSKNLHIVDFVITRGIRFLPAFLSNRAQRKDAGRLEQFCDTTFDVVWSFDNSRFFYLPAFGKCLKIAHIMDLGVNLNTPIHAGSSDYCFGVTKEIVGRLKRFNAKTHFINHGFAPIEALETEASSSDKKQVAYSGNLLLNFIDRKLVLKVVNHFPDVCFNFYGGYTKSNLSDGGNKDSQAFIEQLQKATNVKLHGALDRKKLLVQLAQQDVLLMFYDSKKYAGACHNSHKIMEYLSTGKEILSTPILEYAESELILQVEDHDSYISQLTALLEKEADHEVQAKRIAYAADHTYLHQINRIQSIVNAG